MTPRAIPRSVLYTPALALDRVRKAWTYDADLHLIDLEDSVPRPAKAVARTICRQALQEAPNPENLAVRINELGSIEAVRDLELLADCPVRSGFLVMTMVRFPAEVILLREVLASAGMYPQIYVTVETVQAIADLDAITAAADGLVLGSADLAATLGVDITWEGMLSARQAMALACARHGAGCIDTANFYLDDPSVLAAEIDGIRALGFHGKVTVHPRELKAINRAFRPDEDELKQARRVTEAVAAANGGIAVLDGNMVGPPFARRARDTVAAGDAWAARFATSKGEAAHERERSEPAPGCVLRAGTPAGGGRAGGSHRGCGGRAEREGGGVTAPLLITAEQMVGEDRLRRVMDALAEAFADLSAGGTESHPRSLLDHGSSELLVSPASWVRRGVATVKVTTLTPGNADRGLPLIHGVVVLTDVRTGQITALLDGAELTAVRTGAVAGLATRLCTPPEAGDLAVLGAGVQARALLRAVAAVRPVRSVRVFSRTPTRTAEFAEWARTAFGIPVTVCAAAPETVRDAEIICTTTSTSAAEPLIQADWVARGAHLNVIGGTHEDALEVDPALLKTALTVVEQRAAAIAEAGEVRAGLAAGFLAEIDLRELGSLHESTVDVSRTTVFRGVGMSLEDAAAAVALYDARSEG